MDPFVEIRIMARGHQDIPEENIESIMLNKNVLWGDRSELVASLCRQGYYYNRKLRAYFYQGDK
jgi:hypothetical protein